MESNNNILSILSKTFPNVEDRNTFLEMISSIYNNDFNNKIYIHYINNNSQSASGITTILNLIKELLSEDLYFKSPVNLNDYINNKGIHHVYNGFKVKKGFNLFDLIDNDNPKIININDEVINKLRTNFNSLSINIITKNLNYVDDYLHKDVKIINYTSSFKDIKTPIKTIINNKRYFTYPSDTNLNIENYKDEFETLIKNFVWLKKN